MQKHKIDPETRKAIRDARKLILDAEKKDVNEADTRKRVDRIFETVMGYDTFTNLTSEYAVSGPGETEYCDFAIQLGEGDQAKPVIFVELKKANVDLARKHLTQVSSYAINAGCEWIILTNGREWKLYHVTFGQPPETKLIHSWNLLNDDVSLIADRFELISFRQVRKGSLDALWEKTSVLSHRNLLDAILSEDSIRLLRRHLKKTTGISVTPEDVVGAIRKLLNEAAATEMANIKFSLSEPKKRASKKTPKLKKETK